jgi:hypothetical protein
MGSDIFFDPMSNSVCPMIYNSSDLLFDSEQINDLLGEDLLGKQVFAEKTK